MLLYRNIDFTGIGKHDMDFFVYHEFPVFVIDQHIGTIGSWENIGLY